MPTLERIRLSVKSDGRKFSVSDSVSSPRAAAIAARKVIDGRDREVLVAIHLDAQNVPTKVETLSVGSLNSVASLPREVFAGAIVARSRGIVLAHNHPSGCLEFSREDIGFAEAMVRAGNLLGIDVYDILIVTDGGFRSMREDGTFSCFR